MRETQEFFRRYPVFSFEEFFREKAGMNKARLGSVKATLQHHLKMGHIVRIRRELYASIPYGADPESYPVSPFLIAGRAAHDSVVAYQSALAFYQSTYSTVYRIIFLSDLDIRTFRFRSEYYKRTGYPPSLAKENKKLVYVKDHDVQGMTVKITSLERTLVDVFDRLDLGGGFEEIYRSLAMIPRLKIDDIVSYALVLGNSTTISKVGFYLSQRQKELNVTPDHLKKLIEHRPLSKHYVDKHARKNGHFLSEWNIIVPKELIDQSWNEPMDEDT